VVGFAMDNFVVYAVRHKATSFTCIWKPYVAVIADIVGFWYRTRANRWLSWKM